MKTHQYVPFTTRDGSKACAKCHAPKEHPVHDPKEHPVCDGCYSDPCICLPDDCSCDPEGD